MTVKSKVLEEWKIFTMIMIIILVIFTYNYTARNYEVYRIRGDMIQDIQIQKLECMLDYEETVCDKIEKRMWQIYDSMSSYPEMFASFWIPVIKYDYLWRIEILYDDELEEIIRRKARK